MQVYALKLENNKYYIGKTSRYVVTRFEEHKSNSDLEWTAVHKPISIIENYYTNSEFEEDILTKKYMIKYGIDNVRGGSYVKMDLDDWQVKSLEHEFKSVCDCCYTCGKKGHFANVCPGINSKLDDYLLQFNSEIKLDNEIKKMENLRKKVFVDEVNIQILKYATYTSNGNDIIKIEIEPNLINTYKNEVKKSCGRLRLLGNSGLNKLIDITSDNINENIYKIYVNRVKKERELNKIFKENNLSINNEYKEGFKELDERIEGLYKKYAEVLVKEKP